MNKLFFSIVLLFAFCAHGSQKRIAIVQDGVVDNLAVWDGSSVWHPCALKSGCQTMEISLDSNIDSGWVCDGDLPETCNNLQSNGQ